MTFRNVAIQTDDFLQRRSSITGIHTGSYSCIVVVTFFGTGSITGKVLYRVSRVRR